jgi:hypothetical protein
MEATVIDKHSFEELMFRAELLAGKVKTLCERMGGNRMKKWYDNQVCA